MQCLYDELDEFFPFLRLADQEGKRGQAVYKGYPLHTARPRLPYWCLAASARWIDHLGLDEVGAGDLHAAGAGIGVVRWESALPGEREVCEVLAGEDGELFGGLRTPVIDGVGKDDGSSVGAGIDMEDGVVDDLNVGTTFPERDGGWGDGHINAGDGECGGIRFSGGLCGGGVRVRWGSGCGIYTIGHDTAKEYHCYDESTYDDDHFFGSVVVPHRDTSFFG